MRVVRTTLYSGVAAALCFGTGIPALAHDTGDANTGDGTSHSHPAPLTLDEAKALAAKRINAKIDRLTELRSKVAADADLTDAQKADYTAKIDKALTMLASAKDDVAAATSVKAVDEALHAAHVRTGHYPRRDHAAVTLAQAKSDATKHLDKAQQKLTALRAKVADDSKLTDDQRTGYLAKIDKALANIASARDAVAAATTVEGVRDSVHDAASHVGAYPHAVTHHASKTPADRSTSTSAKDAKTRTVTVAARTTSDKHTDGSSARHARDEHRRSRHVSGDMGRDGLRAHGGFASHGGSHHHRGGHR